MKEYTIEDLKAELEQINPNRADTITGITKQEKELLFNKIVELTNRIQELERKGRYDNDM